MILLHSEGSPYPIPQFSTDDFGDEVMAVAHYNDLIQHKQIVISQNTWMHLFDLDMSIRAEAALCAV